MIRKYTILHLSSVVFPGPSTVCRKATRARHGHNIDLSCQSCLDFSETEKNDLRCAGALLSRQLLSGWEIR